MSDNGHGERTSDPGGVKNPPQQGPLRHRPRGIGFQISGFRFQTLPSGRGKSSGAPVNRSYANLYTVIDGKIARITQFRTEQDAL
jgi:hypothetical protein